MTQLPFCATGWSCGTVRATEELRARDRRIEEIESGR